MPGLRPDPARQRPSRRSAPQRIVRVLAAVHDRRRARAHPRFPARWPASAERRRLWRPAHRSTGARYRDSLRTHRFAPCPRRGMEWQRRSSGAPIPGSAAPKLAPLRHATDTRGFDHRPRCPLAHARRARHARARLGGIGLGLVVNRTPSCTRMGEPDPGFRHSCAPEIRVARMNISEAIDGTT
jgi:hypothetical protein